MINWLEKLGVRNIIRTTEPKFILVVGPCVIREAGETEDIARELLDICTGLSLPFVFKGSYSKSNRSKGESYRGVGLKMGLAILHSIRRELNIPILTDVHKEEEIDDVGKVVDFVQIPAFLCRQTELIEKAARTQKIINVKKGQFMSPYEMEDVLEKIRKQKNTKYMITERGTSFGYGDLVNDFRGIPIMTKHAPVLYDGTHSIKSSKVGGRQYIKHLSRAAIAAGASGLYLEVHPNPSKSLSDKDSILPLKELKPLLEEIIPLYQLVKTFSSK